MSSRPKPVPEPTRPAPSVVGMRSSGVPGLPPASESGGSTFLSLRYKLAFFFFLCILVGGAGPFLPWTQTRTGQFAYLTTVLAVGVGSWLYFWHVVVGTVRQVTRQAEVFSSGDLTRAVPAPRRMVEDETVELATSINRMVGSLRELVGRIQTASEAVASSSDHLSSATGKAHGAAQEIAGKIEEIARASEREKDLAEETQQRVRAIAKSISTVASGARSASESAARAEQAAHDGRHLSRTTLDKLKLVFERLEHSSVEVSRFGEKSAEIEKIVGVITNISSQTNLLALNATIEAARAGEAGRGFAVVAEEVRKLAESSAKAAEQIAALIEDVREESRRVIETVQDSVRTIAEGHGDLSAIGQTIDRIAGDVQGAAEKVRDIRESTEEVSTEAKTLVDSADAINGLARSNAVATERVASAIEGQTGKLEEMEEAARTLSNLAVEMQKASSNFRL